MRYNVKMSEKNIEFKSKKAKSHDEKKMDSSKHSKMMKSMTEKLTAEIDVLAAKL